MSDKAEQLMVQMTDEQFDLLRADQLAHHGIVQEMARQHAEAAMKCAECAADPKPPIALRDWFAGQAIIAVIRQCAGDLPMLPEGTIPEQYFATKAYNIADAMIEARK